jgi:predicted DNA-binding transcriptional regulator AlpA
MKNDATKPILLPARNVAEKLGVSIRSVDRFARDERLAFPRAIKIGQRNYWLDDELTEWILDRALAGARAGVDRHL